MHAPSVRHRVQSLQGLSVWRSEQAQRSPAAEAPAAVGDTVSLSPEAVDALTKSGSDELGSEQPSGAEPPRGAGIYTARGHGGRALALGRPDAVEHEQSTTTTGGVDELTEQEQQEVDGLEARDAEVRQHEQAHAARGGSHAGSPQYGYKTGPDGQRYIADGSVSIDVSKVQGDLKATVRKMETVIAAATAPAQPSAQDRSVARAARATAQEARAELAAEARETEGTPPAEAPEATETPSAEQSEQYVAATRLPRSPVRPRSDSLRAYRANAGPMR